jgi:hypothetical protein
MAHGSIVADGPPTEIKAMVGTRTIRATLPDAPLEKLELLPGVSLAERRGKSVVLSCTDSDAAIRALLATFGAAKDIEISGAGLEQAFLGPAFASRFRLTAALAVLSIVPMTALTLTWANSAPDHGSIWHDVLRLPSGLGSSWLAQTMSSNVLHSAGVGVPAAGALVALAAASAFVLALPLRFRR